MVLEFPVQFCFISYPGCFSIKCGFQQSETRMWKTRVTWIFQPGEFSGLGWVQWVPGTDLVGLVGSRYTPGQISAHQVSFPGNQTSRHTGCNLHCLSQTATFCWGGHPRPEQTRIHNPYNILK